MVRSFEPLKVRRQGTQSRRRGKPCKGAPILSLLPRLQIQLSIHTRRKLLYTYLPRQLENKLEQTGETSVEVGLAQDIAMLHALLACVNQPCLAQNTKMIGQGGLGQIRARRRLGTRRASDMSAASADSG